MVIFPTATPVPVIAVLMLCLAVSGAFGEQETTLPASADQAVQRLTDSPRHGEWLDVPLGDDEPPLRSWVVYPERADDAAVVIVIHEIFGLTDWVRAVADQVAAEGYVAIAPDLLSGRGPGGGGTESFAGDDIRGAIRELEVAEVNRRLDAARVLAGSLPGAADRTGVIGFCWGGTASFNYAIDQPELNAAVVFYGTGPAAAHQVSTIVSPVLGLYGGDDARVTSTVEATADAMRRQDKTFVPHIYDGAGHAFVRQQDGREGANLAAARQGWAEMVRFLREHLGD